MHAVEISRPGGPEVLVPVERPTPEAGAGEVLIKVSAAGVTDRRFNRMRPSIAPRKRHQAG